MVGAVIFLVLMGMGGTSDVTDRAGRPLIVKGDIRDGRVVALTFDDGPDPVTTPILLDHLDSLGVPATFFVVGKNLAQSWRNREVLEEEARRGHTIGNHSFSHPNFYHIPPQQQAEEVRATEKLVLATTGRRTVYFRPPYGAMSRFIVRWARNRHYTIVMWNMDASDPFVRSAAEAFSKGVAFVWRLKGGIFLSHDTHVWSVSAIPRMVREIWLRNCELMARGESPVYFVPLSRFVQSRGKMPTDDEIADMEEQYEKQRRFCESLEEEGR